MPGRDASGRRRKAPLAGAGHMAEKYIVIVPVRPNAAPGRGKTHHQVIDAPVRHKGNSTNPCLQLG